MFNTSFSNFLTKIHLPPPDTEEIRVPESGGGEEINKGFWPEYLPMK